MSSLINQPLLNEAEDDFNYNSVNSQDGQTQRRSEDLQYRPHPLRWYILSVLCILNISNAMTWISFAPVPYYSAEFFNTTEDVINWLSVVFMIATIPFGLVAIWVLDTHGLRAAFVTGSWLNFVGLVIRYLSTWEIFFHLGLQIYILFLGQILPAIAQAFFLFAPTKLAATWFPDNHRALANTIGSTSNALGILAAFIASPIIVTEKGEVPEMLFWYIFPGALGCLMATLCIYRGTPPIPPSPSAAMAHRPFFTGVKTLFTTKAYVMLFISFGGGFGLFSALSSLLPQMVCVKGYDTNFAALCGGSIIVAGFFGAVIAGLYVDSTKKFALAGKVCISVAVIFICLLYVVSQLENQKILLATSTAGFGFFGFATLPISYELGVEATYPIAEGTSGGFLAMSGQIQGIILVVVGQYLAVEISPEDLDIQKCRGNATEGFDNMYSISTTAESKHYIQDLKNTALFFAIYSVISAIIYIFGVRTKYYRLIAEEKERLEGTLNLRSEGQNGSQPIL